MSAAGSSFADAPGERFDRVYLGSEFCQSLLPGPGALREMLERVPAYTALTLATPPLSDAGLQQVEALLGVVSERDRAASGPTEVLVNDWGALALVAARPPLVPVLGRLLTRMLRDPRIPASAGAERADGPNPPDAVRAARQSAVTSAPFRALLRKRGIARVELDAVSQGLAMDFATLGLAPTVHAPFGYVTTGRVCLFAAMGQPEARRFEVGAGCHQECRRFGASMSDPSAPAGAAQASLVTAGNTVFQRHPRESIARAWAALSAPGRRLVVRASPFDELAWATDDAAAAERWIAEVAS